MQGLLIKGLIGAALGLGLNASDAQAQGFHLGVKVGANMYKNSSDYVVDKYYGYPLGGVYLGLSGEKMSLMVEGNFTQTSMVTGDNFNEVFRSYIKNGREQIDDARFTFTEFSVPVLLGFKVLPATWLELGPQFTKIVSMNDKEDVLNEIRDVYKDSYVSAAIGLRIKLPLHFHVSARYVHGLSDINRTSVNDTWSTRHIQLGVGFGF